jgi:toxin ParE1/3/4
MVQVVWLDSALDDLAEVRRFIALDSPSAAERVVNRIVQSTRRLEQFPQSGRIVPEYGRPDLREVIVDAYRIVYRIRGDVVAIASVEHGARQRRDIPGV